MLTITVVFSYTILRVSEVDTVIELFRSADKTEMFLELHGNSLVRLQCMEYVQQASTELIKYVINIVLQSS